MASPVYSTRFLVAQGSSSSSTYTVPAGFVAVARCLDAYANVLGTSDLFFHNASGGTIWWFRWSPTDRKPAQWQGRQVFYAGELITVETSTAPTDGIDFALSGYLLAL